MDVRDIHLELQRIHLGGDCWRNGRCVWLGLGFIAMLSIAEGPCEMSQNACGNPQIRYSRAQTRREMQDSIRLIAGMAVEESRKAALNFAARVLRMPYDRVFRIYYGQAARIEAHEADRIRAFIQQAEDVVRGKAAYEARRAEFVANAPRAMAAIHPPALPDLEASPPSIKRRA